MGHFGLDKWVDYARDLIDDAQKAAMQRHLESGCADCGTVLQMWKRVQEMGQRDSLYEPPESAVRSVKGNYAIHGHRQVIGGAVIARLLFDSLSHALPVGVRSSETSARQLLYDSGAYEIDLRLEPQFDSDKVSIVGQVLPPDALNCPVNEILVALVRDDETVAESVTNALGEFQLSCDVEGSFKLQFEPSQGNNFYIPLIDPGCTRPSSWPNGSSITHRSSAKRRSKKRV